MNRISPLLLTNPSRAHGMVWTLALFGGIWLLYLFAVRDPMMLKLGYEFDDKIGHFLAYGGLAVLAVYAVFHLFRTTRITCGLWGIAVATGVGGWTEYLQSAVPGRAASGFDLLADFLGAALFAWLPYFLTRLADRWQKRAIDTAVKRITISVPEEALRGSHRKRRKHKRKHKSAKGA